MADTEDTPVAVANTDSSTTRANTPPQATQEAVPPTLKSSEAGSDNAAQRQKHHHLARMLPHRKKPNKPRMALPLPGSSGPVTPNNPDGEATNIAEDERVQNEAVPMDEGHKSHVKFMRQVLDWVKDERQRQRDRATKREARRAERKVQRSPPHAHNLQQGVQPTEVLGIPIPDRKAGSTDENGAPSTTDSGSPESTSSAVGASGESLDRLEQIAKAGLAASSSSLRLMTGMPKVLSRQPSRKALRPLSRPATSYGSDTDVAPDGDVLVPECEVTLGTPEKIGWDGFKEEVFN